MADAKLMSDWEEMEGLANQTIDDSMLADDKEEDDPSFRPALASNLNSSDIFYEMEKRQLKTTGFPDTDRELLQRAFDEEFKEDLENARARRRDIRRRAIQQANLKRRRQLMEQTLQEEQVELAKNYQVSMMIDLVKDNLTADTVKIEVTSVTARALAKAMWANNTITCLDLSTNSINDHAGSYIARILKRNNTLKKIELDNNALGPKTCQAFGEALKVNKSLKSLSLDSNPLTSNGADFSGIEQFAEALSENNSLVYLNLWRTEVGSKGGLALSRALSKNDSLLFFDVGHNGIDLCDMKDIANKLDDNLANYEIKERQRRADEASADIVRKKKEDVEEVKFYICIIKSWFVIVICL